MDDRGRLLAEILAWPDALLEAQHDFIQWLFPLPVPSGVNPGAPLLDERRRAAFRSDARITANLQRAFARMVAFYGFALEPGERITIVRGPRFEARAAEWLHPMNHNFLRLTRILRGANLTGNTAYCQALFAALEALYVAHGAIIGARTFGFWRRAACDPVPP